MRCPTSVGYAYGACAILILCCLFQGRNLALSLIYGNLLLVIAQQGNASRIVTAVFKPVKT